MPGLRDAIAVLRNRFVPVGTDNSPEDAHVTALWEAIGLLTAELDAPDPEPVLPDTPR